MVGLSYGQSPKIRKNWSIRLSEIRSARNFVDGGGGSGGGRFGVQCHMSFWLVSHGFFVFCQSYVKKSLRVQQLTSRFGKDFGCAVVRVFLIRINGEKYVRGTKFFVGSLVSGLGLLFLVSDSG